MSQPILMRGELTQPFHQSSNTSPIENQKGEQDLRRRRRRRIRMMMISILQPIKIILSCFLFLVVLLFTTIASAHSSLSILLLFSASLSFLFLFFSSRRSPVLLLDYSCYKPGPDRKCSYQVCERFVLGRQCFSTESQEFMRKIYLKSGLGDETYAPPFVFNSTESHAKLDSAMQEAQEGIFSAVNSLLSKTKLDPRLIDAVIVTCGSFSPSPSISSLIVNRYGLKEDVKAYNLSGMGCSSGVISTDLAATLLQNNPGVKYALVVITESISLNWYFGDNRSMLVTNCIFRVGCAAALLTNDRSRRADCKMQLLCSLRTHHGSNDQAYRAAFQEEDEKGNTGISLTKDLIPVAGKNLHDHVKKLGPLVLPLSELMSYGYSKIISALAGTKPKVPDFTTAFDHVCIHTGGKAVIEQVARVLRLSEEVTEPAKMSLHRFGNTSSSLVWYELAYFEGKRRIRRGDKLWMLAFGTGFKVGSLVWKALRDSSLEDDNPWRDCIDSYPVTSW